jgi:hypothetical protein
MVPKFEGDTLLCPSCGASHLYYDKVQIFIRDKKDDKSGLLVEVDVENGCSHTLRVEDIAQSHLNWVRGHVAGHPPHPRRDGVSLYLICDACQYVYELMLVQRDKQTSMNFNI